MIWRVRAAKRWRPGPLRSDLRDDGGLPATAVKTKVWLERDGRFVIGDGGLRLLLGILEHGSLLAAARQIRWSYRHALGYLRRAGRALGTPLTEPRPGKGASRGTVLTEAGRLAVERLAAIRNRIDDVVGPLGPTAADVASRGRHTRRPGNRAASSVPPSRPSRYRDGDWRRTS
jgi:molybdate transport system regulatory protein